MNIDTRVEPLEGRLPTVEWRWDVETDILSGGFRAALGDVVQHAPGLPFVHHRAHRRTGV